MQNITIPAGENTPYVRCDFQKGVFEFKGASYPEYAREFYDNIVEKLEIYIQNPTAPQTHITFAFTYFNTGTNPPLMTIFKALEKMPADHPLQIEWCYEDGDEDIRDLGEYFNTLTTLPIHLISLPIPEE